MIGARIRTLTRRHGIALEDLAEAIGWQRSSFSDLTRSTNPTLLTVHRIARGLSSLGAPTVSFTCVDLDLPPDYTRETLRKNLLTIIDRGIDQYDGDLKAFAAVIARKEHVAVEAVRRAMYCYRESTYPKAKRMSDIATVAGVTIRYLEPIGAQ